MKVKVVGQGQIIKKRDFQESSDSFLCGSSGMVLLQRLASDLLLVYQYMLMSDKRGNYDT